MPDTSLGITYPASTDSVQIWTHLQTLADDVNTLITADRARLTAIEASLVDAVNVTTNPIIAAAAFSSETDVPRLALSGTVVAGSAYAFVGQLLYSFTNTDTEADLRIRHTTAVSGTLIGRTRLSKVPTSGFGMHVSWWVPWIATSSGAMNFYISVKRSTGTGNVSLDGGDATFAGLVKLATGGTLRTA